MKQYHIVGVNTQLCTGCGLCERDCPSASIVVLDGKAAADMKNCIRCGHCQAICPVNAVSLSGFAEEPEAITPAMRVAAEALLGQLKARRSVRQFTSREIPQELINKIIEAGRYTPTGTNKQGVSYTVLVEHVED